MLTTTEEAIHHVFSKYLNDIDEILKLKNGDFAFVHFKNRVQAEIVKNMTHGKL